MQRSARSPKLLLAALTVWMAGACSGGSGSNAAGTSAGPGGSTGASVSGTGSTGGNASSGSGSAGSVAGSGVSGSTTGATGSTTGGPLSETSFAQTFNATYCDHVVQCYRWAPYITSICSSGAIPLGDYAALPEAIDAGRVSYNPAAAAPCIGTLEDAGCRTDVLAACSGAVVGQVGTGGACYGSTDCTNQDCANNDLATCTPGTCAPTVGLGAACDCAGCGACDRSVGLVCANSICAPAGFAGSDCSGDSAICAPSLACIAGSCTTLPVRLGGACNSNQGNCVEGTYCLTPAGETIGTCTKQDSMGSPCGQDADHAPNAFDLLDNQCAGAQAACAGAGTDLDGGPIAGTCSRLHDLGGDCVPPGSAIDQAQSYITGCYTFLNCTGGTCLRPPTSGACGSNSSFNTPCDPIAAFCDDGGSCHVFVGLGGTCTQDNQCGIEAQCNGNGICQADTSCSPQL